MVPNFIDHILVLVFGLVLPFFSGIRGSEKLGNIYFDEPTRRKFFISNSLLLWFFTGVVMLIWWLYARPFSLMGFRKIEPGWVPWALTGVMVAAYVTDLIYSVFSPEALKKTHEQWESSVPFLPEYYRELPAYTFMCITAGVCEEILFRGFMVTYFIDPMQTGFPWMAAVFPAVLFSLAHFYQGYKAMFKIFFLSLLFALIFIFSKSLVLVVVIHFLVDFVGGIAAIRMKKNG